MRNRFMSVSALFLALATVFLCACGDTKKGGGNASRGDSADPASSISYDFSQDTEFLPKDIFTSSMYVNGLVPTKEGDECYIDVKGTSDSACAIVFPAEYGKCYEIKFPNGTKALRAATVSTDPRLAPKGSKISYATSVRYYSGTPKDPQISFMFTARQRGQYFVLYTGNSAPKVQILERTMIQDTDTEGLWFTPPTIKNLTGTGDFYADYRWNSDTVYKNLFDHNLTNYPDYVTKEYLGKDQSGKYDMYGYVYTPESYKTTLFITSGMHSYEEMGYLCLAAFLQLVCDAKTNEDPLLWFMRTNVRLVVVPMMNVWGISQDPNRPRENSSGKDLNRDWDSFTQQESKNVLAFFKEYKDDIDIALDLHTCGDKNNSLYYNFINFTPNAVANYKTTNHMYHRFMEEGILTKTPAISNIPGSYQKSDPYIEGRIWNEFNIPTITVEYGNYPPSNPNFCNEADTTLAVEVYGNFIIQNALFFSQEK